MLNGRFIFESDPARYELLPLLLRSVIQPGGTWVDRPLFERLCLAVHELLVNISRHANHRCNGLVEMHVSVGPTSVMISVYDGGKPYDGAVESHLPSEPTVGGYGLPLVTAIADHVRYRRVGGENHWQLEFVHPSEQAS